VNEETLAHWGAVAPKTNKRTNKQKKTFFTGTERIRFYLLNHLIPCGAAYKQIYLSVFTNHNQMNFTVQSVDTMRTTVYALYG
jgi:hypothetical protein